MSKDNPTADEPLDILKKQYGAYNPTVDELEAILQHQYGAYGVELPDWYVQNMSVKENAAGFPLEAVAAVAKVIWDADDAAFSGDYDYSPRLSEVGATELAGAALKAAAPIMFAKMQEQQAQLDAVKAQLEVWEKQSMEGNDLTSITARFAFETVCKRLRTALGTVK